MSRLVPLPMEDGLTPTPTMIEDMHKVVMKILDDPESFEFKKDFRYAAIALTYRGLDCYSTYRLLHNLELMYGTNLYIHKLERPFSYPRIVVRVNYVKLRSRNSKSRMEDDPKPLLGFLPYTAIINHAVRLWEYAEMLTSLNDIPTGVVYLYGSDSHISEAQGFGTIGLCGWNKHGLVQTKRNPITKVIGDTSPFNPGRNGGPNCGTVIMSSPRFTRAVSGVFELPNNP